MKKTMVLFISILMIVGLTACGSTSSKNNSSEDNSTSETFSAAATEKGDGSSDLADETNVPTQATGKKVLVVYYSASGNTERIAESIADAADADTFEIVPQKVYTSDDLNWTDTNSRVSREHDDESLRDVPLKTTAVDNWDDYDTVFIGYPYIYNCGFSNCDIVLVWHKLDFIRCISCLNRLCHNFFSVFISLCSYSTCFINNIFPSQIPITLHLLFTIAFAVYKQFNLIKITVTIYIYLFAVFKIPIDFDSSARKLFET